MGNQVFSVTKSVVQASQMKEQQQQKKAISDLKKKIRYRDLQIDAVVFEGGGAKALAYVGAAEVSHKSLRAFMEHIMAPINLC